MSLTLTNYWWLLIWLFLGGAIFQNMPKRRERLGGETVARWQPLYAIAMVLPYILWTGFRHNYFGDTALYRRLYLELEPTLGHLFSLFSGEEKDPGFTAFSILLKSIIGNADKLFFLIIGTFQLVGVTLIFRRYSDHFWTTFFLFVVSTDYLSWTHNGMRQFIAVVIIFVGFKYLISKRYIPMILLILLASSFHGSALLMLPIIFVVRGRAWNRKTVIMLALTMVVIAFIDQFTPILDALLQETQYDGTINNEIWSVDDGTNIMRVFVYSIPALMALFGLKHVRAANNPIMNVCINCSIVTMALYLVASVSSGIYIGRLPIYTTLYGYIALPWMIDIIFERRSAQLIRYIMYGAYLAFFYFQMHFAWGAI